MKLIFLSFMVVSECFGSIPNIYYSHTAAGSNNGTDCADAYAYNDGTNGFNTAGKWGSGSTQIGADTIVHVCDVITGSAGVHGILIFQGGGTSGHPVTLKFESGAGLSAPYCDWQADSSGCLVISTPSAPNNNIVIDGGTPCGWTVATGSEGTCNGTIVNTASGTASNQGTATTAVMMQNCTNCELKNIGINNIYVQSGGDTNANPQDENCVAFSGTNVKIHDSLMHDVGWCLWYVEGNGDSGMSVYNNEIYNTPHPVNFSGGNSGTASNAFFYSNYWHDFENWNTPSCTYHVEGFHIDSTGAIFNNLYIYNNYIGKNSGLCLFADLYYSGFANQRAGITAAVSSNVVTFTWPGGQSPASDGYVNSGTMGIIGYTGADTFFNGVYTLTGVNSTSVTAALIHANASSSSTGTASAGGMVNNSYAFNNVLYTDGDAGMYAVAMGAGNGNAFYNNTFINTSSGSNATGGGLSWANVSALQYTMTFENNATQGFYAQVQTNDPVNTSVTADYNVYSQCPAGGSVEGECLVAFGNPGSTWSTYVSNSYSQESHSINTGLFSSVSCCTGTLNLNSAFVPNIGSAVIGAGTNLTSSCSGNLAPLCSDAAGNARSSSGAWTIGAYNYQAPASGGAVISGGYLSGAVVQ